MTLDDNEGARMVPVRLLLSLVDEEAAFDDSIARVKDLTLIFDSSLSSK